MRKHNFVNAVLAALFAAMIFVMTRFVQIPTFLGYIHPGDAIIYLSAAILPAPYSLLSAGIGGAMADLSSGYVIYVPITILVKVLLALCFTNKGEKLFSVRNIIAPVICIIITVGGYFAFEIFYYGAGAYATILPNLIQGVCSGVIFIFLAFAFDKVNLKKKLQR
ncbi:MAG: TIGR04002 family protein [Oscillospiraceae bacterium]|nr:TIGR04002 family protein [Oscillospiraceae bacterium]